MKVLAAVIAFAEGSVELNVAAVCRELKVSRKTFYKYVARYRAEGVAGFEERSRRPTRSPGQCPAEVEDSIVRLRKELTDLGLDHGAATIQWHLGRLRLVKKVPSEATIHRVLIRRGLVVAEPRKRPKCSWQRFEAPAPNEWWQIDATGWVTQTGPVKIFNVIDDHSRVLTASMAAHEETTSAAWKAFCLGVMEWGLPAGVLSDNGLAFSGKLRHIEVEFEANLRDAGVRPFNGRGYHPQTTGKIERFHETLKQWLRKQPLAADLDQLHAQLDKFRRIYNYERPHQGIGGVTPISRWTATPASKPADRPLEHPVYSQRRSLVHNATVTTTGVVNLGHHDIHIGSEWAGQSAVVYIDEHNHAVVFINQLLIRYLTIDTTRRYQPSRRPRSRSPKLT